MSRTFKKALYIVFPILIGISNYVVAYTMPVGIPEANIDFTAPVPDRPSNWVTEIPGYYYVDAENGSTSATYGSEKTPIKTLPKSIPAGSYVEIAGDLKLTGSYVVKVNGTSADWVANNSGAVWITGSKTKTGTIIGGKLTLTGENVYVTDLNFKKGGKPQIGSPTAGYTMKNIVIRNNDIDGSNIAGEGLGINRATNAVVYNNIIHDFGDINISTDEDAHLISIGSTNNNIWILANIQHTASGAGLQVLGSSDNTSNIFVGDNEVYNVRQSGIWLKGGKNVVFSSNFVHDIIHTSWSVSKGIGAQYAPDGLWIINNYIEGAEYGIRIASSSVTEFTQNIYIIGNVIHNITEKSETGAVGGINSWQSAGIHLVGGNEIWVYNNLIFDATNGVTSSSNIATIHIKNNIIFDLTNNQKEGSYGRSIWSEFTKIESGKIELSNNYFDEHMLVQEGSKTFSTVSSLIALGATKNISRAQFLSNSELEEVINNKSIEGFDLSSLTDQGSNTENITTTLYSTVFNNVNEGLNTDILGAQRKQGNYIEIGPFETNGSVAIEDRGVPESPVLLNILQIIDTKS